MFAGVDPQVPVALELRSPLPRGVLFISLPVAISGLIEFRRLPDGKTQLREARRIGSGIECLHCSGTDRLMLTMAVGCFTGVSTDEDLRLHEPDGSDDLADQRFPPPLGHRLGSAGAVAEIVERTVPGLAAIDRTCREALPRAIDAERVA